MHQASKKHGDTARCGGRRRTYRELRCIDFVHVLAVPQIAKYNWSKRERGTQRL